MNNENKNYLFSKYFYDKDNEINKHIQSKGSEISLKNTINKDPNSINSKNTIYLKNGEFLLNKAKLKITEFELSQNFSVASFHKFLIMLLDKKRLKFGIDNFIYGNLNILILDILIRKFNEYFSKNYINLASEILEICFKISEPLPNTKFQLSLDYGIRKCNILYLAVLLSEKINSLEKAVEYLKILINTENSYKKTLADLNMENYEKDKFLVLTNNFLINENSTKDEIEKNINIKNNKNINDKDFKNNLRLKYNFDFSMNFKFNKLYFIIIKELLLLDKLENSFKYIDILLNLYKSFMRSENIIKKIYEEKIKIEKQLKADRVISGGDIGQEQNDHYEIAKNYQSEFFKKKDLANYSNMLLNNNSNNIKNNNDNNGKLNVII